MQTENGKSYLALFTNPKDYTNANPKDYTNANPKDYYTNAGKATLLHVKYLLVKWWGEFPRK